jgi:hypothetical protein
MKDQKQIEEEIDNAINIFKRKKRLSKKRINFYRAILLLLYSVEFEKEFKFYVRLMGRKVNSVGGQIEYLK